MYKLKGEITLINDTKIITNKFSKREFVVMTDADSQYPQYISLQLTKDKCSILDNFQEKDQVEVSFYLRGRQWESDEGTVKYFNSLEVWKIEKLDTEENVSIANQNLIDDNFIDDDAPF